MAVGVYLRIGDDPNETKIGELTQPKHAKGIGDTITNVAEQMSDLLHNFANEWDENILGLKSDER